MTQSSDHLLKADMPPLDRRQLTWSRLVDGWRAHPVIGRIKAPSGKATAWTLGIIGGLLLAIILFLGLFDWNYLKRPVERIASAQIGLPVKIDGNLSVKLLSWTPGATVEGVRIANPAWAAGANNWTCKKRSKTKPLALPPIQNFEINDGVLLITDRQRRLVFKGKVTSSEIRDGRSVHAFHLMGDGTLNNAPFDLNLTGGPLLNVDRDKPYPFRAEVVAGPTQALAQGSIAKPFNLGVFTTSLSLSGPDLSDVYYLTGLALPNTPPYRLAGQLSRRNNLYRYDRINGRIGDSDLASWLSVTTGRKRPRLKADLSSKSLDFDDLATVLGAAPKSGSGETISAEQVLIKNQMEAQQRLLPDAPLRVERLRSMDAEVKFRAAAIRSDKLPVRRGSVNLTLDNGLLVMDPLEFGLIRGDLAGRVAINARHDIPGVDMDMRMSGARLEEFLPVASKGAVSGVLLGRAKLTGQGRSVREAAASANGQVTLVSSGGQIREALAELMGVNVVKGLGFLWSGENRQTELRCAVADFKATNGVLTAQTIVFDTEPVLVTGGGTVDLRTERMALRVKGRPKEARLLRLAVPITLNGPLTKPDLGIDSGQAVGQVGIAAVIGTVLAPLAAILPFVNPGLEKDANCAGLVARAETGKPARTKVAGH